MPSPDKDRRKALRSAYKNAQREAGWAALGVDRGSLDSLYGYLDERLVRRGCDHSLSLCEEWAAKHREVDWPRLREGLRNAGGYCDCEVRANTDPDQTL
ncbi:DUF2695 domain-containing protein [Micromonospora sp. NPDC047644]|uniref:DUF2695 domain-containing protein n=1 Tax=Micromonospora sp. NPDC047644 TaxID=3157203 RepID=UPI003452A375